MRLNWFSPLPPARTGIAGYTRQILPALLRRVDIILWTDQAEWDLSLESYTEVRRYHVEQMPWAELNRGDLSIYHIGNTALFHGAIWQVSRQHPGIVVLHDLHLHEFFAALYCDQWRDHDGYRAEMERRYGPVGRQDAEAFWRGELTADYMSTHYPLTSLAVENALGGIVHSEAGLDELTQECPSPVVYVPLPYPASSRPTQDHLETERRRTQGLPYRIIIFGILNTNRRLDALLEALAGFPEKEQFRIHIYGQLWDEGQVHNQIRLLGLQELVTVHGFVPEVELDAALETSHLAVNLRYPTMGEASASQLRIWDYALPTLVTRVGWYANLPESAVAFVRPEYEIKDIQGHLQAFLADPGRFARMGENGRRILEEHHVPGAYVQALMELAAQVVCLRPYVASRDLIRRLKAEITLWANLPAHTLEAWFWERGLTERHPKVAIPKRLKRFEGNQVAASGAISEATATLLDDFRRQRDATLQVIHQAVAAHADSLHLADEDARGVH